MGNLFKAFKENLTFIGDLIPQLIQYMIMISIFMSIMPIHYYFTLISINITHF